MHLFVLLALPFQLHSRFLQSTIPQMPQKRKALDVDVYLTVILPTKRLSVNIAFSLISA